MYSDSHAATQTHTHTHTVLEMREEAFSEATGSPIRGREDRRGRVQGASYSWGQNKAR